MKNSLKYIQSNLYNLKRDYGSIIDLYHKNSINIIETGKKKTTRTKYTIYKAIILPTTLDLATTMARGFTKEMGRYGDVGIEVADRVIIIDTKDLLKYNIKLDSIDPASWYVIIQHHRYEISKVKNYEFDAGIILMLKETKGAEVAEVFSPWLRTIVGLNQHVIVDKNKTIIQTLVFVNTINII